LIIKEKANKLSFVEEARGFLGAAGYAPSLLSADYSFTWRRPEGDLVNGTLPLVAFAAAPFTLRTACVSVFAADSDALRNDRLQQVRFLASPIAIVSNGPAIELWAIRRDAEASQLARTDSTDWPTKFRSRIPDLSPGPILASKSGEYQLDFVDSGLVEWAERITEQTLTILIEDVLRSAIALRHPHPPFKGLQFKQAILRLVFNLFACRVLEDKSVIPRLSTAQEALEAAHARFSGNIDPNILSSPLLDSTVVLEVFSQLRNRFAFASLTTEMLGHVYENSLVTPELRHENGIYYTPRIVANYILNRLPVESLSQDKRLLMDPCCGSGSFLLAGFDRLSGLLPSSLTPAQSHQYLRARLVGSDIDEFAIETAVLSLVIRDPLNKNGWRVDKRDIMTIEPTTSSTRPTIIVTNPPFKEIKHGGSRKEFAAEALLKALHVLAPGGLLGIILPQSILDSHAGSEARAEVLRRCDLLEIVTLPGGIFFSNADTTVMMARKKVSTGVQGWSFPPKVLTVRELHSQDLPRFRALGGFTATYSVDVDTLGTDAEHRFVLSPLAELWKRLEGKYPRLGDVGIVKAGLQVKKDDHESVSQRRRKGDVQFVNRLDILRPYALILDQDEHKLLWLKFGDHLRRMGDAAVFDAPKVLLNSNRNPGTAWRLVAAPAKAGLYFSDNFHGLIPRSGGPSIYVLSAILNNSLSNAWFHAHCRKRKIVQSTLVQLPTPRLDEPTALEIHRLAVRLEQAIQSSERLATEGLFYDGPVDSSSVNSLVAEIDELLYSSYNLSSTERRALDAFMTNEKRPS
jgi:hypothetical protein